DLLVAGERIRDREVGVAVSEVGRAVERVDVPPVRVLAGLGRRLLGDDPVRREGRSDRIDDEALGVPVRRRDEVDLPLEGDLLSLTVAGAEERAGTRGRRVRHALVALHLGLLPHRPGATKYPRWLTARNAEPSMPGFAEAAASAGGRSPSW